MQPSSDQTGAGGGGSGLRRWGPIAAIVVVLAVVAALVVTSGGDDDDPEDSSTEDTRRTGGELPDGAVTWAMAEEAGTLDDYTFEESCDMETGKLLMPLVDPPDCFADVADNGGETAPGVTADSVKIVVYQAQEADPVLSFITAPIAADDTNPQEAETYQGFADMYNEVFQTYGRTIELEFLEASGFITDEVAARADAVKAMEEMGAFAVWGGPALSNAWTEEVKARGGVCIGCPGLADGAPAAFNITPSATQIRLQFAEYLSEKLLGKPAIHAGDEAFHDVERVFGSLYIDTGSQDSLDGAEESREVAEAAGIVLKEQIGYELDPNTLAEQASTAISRLKASGVTTVLIGGDPIAPKTFTEVATQQDYHPEWVLNGAALQDTTAFGRTYDQEQWSHAFGLSSLAARVVNGKGTSENLYQWWAGEYPPADDTVGVLFPNPAMFFTGLQAAGPNLTVESFRDGMFAGQTPEFRGVTEQVITFGNEDVWPNLGDYLANEDYQGIDDMTELWWDPTVEGADEIRKPGVGMYRYVDGGKRYLPGEWTDELKVFDEEGTSTVYDDLPEGEELPDVPPHPKSPAAA